MENNELIGIAPLMLSEYPFLYNCTKIRKLEFIGRGNSDYNTFIFKNGFDKVSTFFIKYLLTASDWDIIELLDVSEESPTANLIQSKINTRFPNFKFKVSNLCPHIDLPSSIEVYTKSLSRNLRKNLNKRLKRLEKEYTVEFKTQNDFSSITDAMNTFLDLHDKRWASKEGQSAFIYGPNRDFHLEIAKIFNEKNWLSLYFLAVNGKPIAGIYSFDYNQKKYGYNTGFNPKFAKYGIGNMLKNYVITDSIKKGLNEYDLLRGYEPYKENWSTGVRKNYVAFMFNKSWRGSLFLQINKLKQQFKGKN